MPQARITVDGTPGSNNDVDPNVLIQLDNQNSGGEVSYLWAIAAQPPGTADNLDSTVIANPTFTPKKEGTYRLTLQVNGDPALQNSVIVAVRQQKTNFRVPAAGETTQDNTSTGWAEDSAVGPILRFLDESLARPGLFAAVADNTVAADGQVVSLAGVATILATLPGEQVLPEVTLTDPTDPATGRRLRGIVLKSVRGGAIGNGVLVQVIVAGIYPSAVNLNSAVAPVAGDPVYASDSVLGDLTLDPTSTVVGYVLSATLVGGSTYAVVFMVSGMAGAGGSVTFTTKLLSASGGDVLPTTPPGGPTDGYPMKPNYTAIRIAAVTTAARVITQWVQLSDLTWQRGGQIYTRAASGTGTAGTVGNSVNDNYVLVGAGRIYFQNDDGVGALTAEITAEVSS